MSQQQHTPEPWAVSVEIFDNDGVPETAIQALNRSATVAVALDFGLNNPEMREANARRIVACVNACAGIDTELLGIIADNDKTLAGVIAELEKQRDTLLAALESISKITYDAGFNIGGPLEHCPGNIGHDEAKRLLSLACEYLKDTSKAAHRAIASVKEQA